MSWWDAVVCAVDGEGRGDRGERNVCVYTC